MPVLSNQKAVEQLYEYPIRQAAGWAVYCTSSSIHQSLHLFRTHHQKCAARRKQALCHELRQEDQRTEWLKRKYFDSVRQQQQAISATRVDSNNPCRFEDHGQKEQESSNKSSPQNISNQVSMETDILIKKEPESSDTTSSPCTMAPELPTFNTSDIEQKQRVPKAGVSKWDSLKESEDTRDELKLTAYDVIAGVISTPPIKPLEQDTDNHSVPRNGISLSSSNSKAGNAPTSSVTTSVTASTTLPATSSAFIQDQQTLDQDLDEFSKVYDQVTQEQKAKERRHSIATELEPIVYPHEQPPHILDPPPRQRPSHLLDPPPYLSVGQPCPSQQNGFFQHKYVQIRTPTQSQVNPAYIPKNINPQQILSSTCGSLTDSPTSGGNHLPTTPTPTPTTPLEHFSNFQSSPHFVPGPSHNQSTPPPPYHYNHEPVHQTTASTPSNKRWPQLKQPLHSGLPKPNIVTHQENSKEDVLAHDSPCVVALTGQKRPIQEFNTLPSTKVHAPLIGSSHSYHPSSALPLTPSYPGPSPAPSFVHHSL